MRLPTVQSLRRQSLALVGLIIVLVMIAGGLGWLDGPELNAVNLAFQLRGPQAPRSPVVIVAIDDTTIRNTGLQWPWPRTYFAQIVDRLAAGGARVIAFDVFFIERESPGQPATYTFQGERFADIAARYGVSQADLIAANNLDSRATVCAGQKLVVPTQPAQEHIVLRDSVEALAARYGLLTEELLAWNPADDPCGFLPGELLRIPVRGPVTYTALDGDSVARVASLFQVNPLAVLAEDGQPAVDPLSAGQRLTVQFGDAALAASLRAAGNVILNGQAVRRAEQGIESLPQPFPELKEAMAGFGITNFSLDADGGVHSIAAWSDVRDQYTYSWPIEAVGLYRGQPPGDTPRPGSFSLGDETVPLDAGFLRINYRGPEGTVPTYPALSVVNGDEPLSTFRDRIVFIGATDVSLQDVYPTPFDARSLMPGVEIMANALDTVWSGEYQYLRSGVCASSENCRLAQRGMMFLSILVSGLMGLGLALIRQPSRAIAGLAGLLIAGVALWLAAFLILRAEIPLVAPLATLLLAFAVPAVERAVSEEIEKRRVRSIFELFISPEMVGQLIDQGVEAMRGKRAELTILFSDIRGFTTMSEKMTPEQLVDVLNEYLGAMTEVIHRHGGTVDKYEGDLVMAFFGAPVWYPDHAERAVRCSIDMRVELDRLRARWRDEGKPSNLEMGIGLNTAEVFVGLVGSGRRVNYTVMGDGVNLASRVQDLTKDLRWPLLITEFTYAHVKDRFEIEYGEAKLVKGKTVPVGMYKVLGEKDAPEDRRVRPLFE